MEGKMIYPFINLKNDNCASLLASHCFLLLEEHLVNLYVSAFVFCPLDAFLAGRKGKENHALIVSWIPFIITIMYPLNFHVQKDHSIHLGILTSTEEEDPSQHSTNDGSSDSVPRCLTCLGDLTRYMLDLPFPPPYHLSVRYYLQVRQWFLYMSEWWWLSIFVLCLWVVSFSAPLAVIAFTEITMPDKLFLLFTWFFVCLVMYFNIVIILPLCPSSFIIFFIIKISSCFFPHFYFIFTFLASQVRQN